MNKTHLSPAWNAPEKTGKPSQMNLEFGENFHLISEVRDRREGLVPATSGLSISECRKQTRWRDGWIGTGTGLKSISGSIFSEQPIVPLPKPWMERKGNAEKKDDMKIARDDPTRSAHSHQFVQWGTGPQVVRISRSTVCEEWKSKMFRTDRASVCQSVIATRRRVREE